MNGSRSILAFGLAVVSTGLALALALVLRPALQSVGEPLFLLAIGATAMLGGLGPGLLALFLSVAALQWWFFLPEQAFGVASVADLLRQLVFGISGLLLAVLGARARALQRQSEARASEAGFRLESVEGRLARARREAPTDQRKLDETVLIVDPDGETRQLASRAVESAGYRWVSACDGVEALELLDRYDVPFALVLTDIRLPDIPGPELMTRISALRPGLPVLYTSAARPGAGTRDEPPALQPVLKKPFTPDELLRRAREVLDHAEHAR